MYSWPFATSRGKERIGKESDAIDVEESRSSPDVGDADFIRECGGGHGCK